MIFRQCASMALSTSDRRVLPIAGLSMFRCGSGNVSHKPGQTILQSMFVIASKHITRGLSNED